MSNIEIDLALVDRKVLSIFEKGEACKYAFEQLIGDGHGDRAKYLQIKIYTESQKVVVVTIPNSVSDMARVSIDGAEV